MVGLDGDDLGTFRPHARLPGRRRDLVPEDIHPLSVPGYEIPRRSRGAGGILSLRFWQPIGVAAANDGRSDDERLPGCLLELLVARRDCPATVAAAPELARDRGLRPRQLQ